MRTLRQLLCLSVALLLGAGCVACEEKKNTDAEKKKAESNSTEAPAEAGSNTTNEATEANTAAPDEAAPGEAPAETAQETPPAEEPPANDVQPPAEEPPPAVGAALLTPQSVDPSTPVAARDLREAYFAWVGKEVVFAGHPMFFFDEGALNESSLTFNADPTDKSTRLVSCENFKTTDDENFARTRVAVIRGTLEPRSDVFPYIRVKDCEKVAILDDMPAAVSNLTPDKAADPSAPVPVTQLKDAFFGWDGKEVAVEGIFNGSTTSGTQPSTRIDLQPVGGGDRMVACDGLPEIPGAELNGVTVVVQGKVAGTFFDQVNLKECRIVKP